MQRGQPLETLAVRRASGHNKGEWEFPGGKLEKEESLRSCLQRELKEELSIEACIGSYIGRSEYQTSSKIIVLHAFLVTEWSGELVLRDHDASRWLQANQLHTLKWSPADIPLIEKVSHLQRLV